MPKIILKNDRYKHMRGGQSRLLQISCRECGQQICRYQKDGPGTLRRMYIDRMSDVSISLLAKALVCPEGHLLGTKMIYEKEDRLAFRLFVSAIAKKIVKV